VTAPPPVCTRAPFMPICPLVGVPLPSAFIVTLPPRVSMLPL
jgi:hypothetical protein